MDSLLDALLAWIGDNEKQDIRLPFADCDLYDHSPASSPYERQVLLDCVCKN